MRRETGFLVGAILLHAGLIAVARRIPPPQRSNDWGVVHALEVELPAELEPAPPTSDEGAASPPPSAPTPAAAPRVPLGQVVAAPQARSWQVTQPNTEGPQNPPSPEATAQPAPSSSGPHWDGPPDEGRGIVSAPRGLETPLWSRPGMIPDAPRAAAAPTAPPPPRPVDPNIAGKVLMAGLAERDKKLGLELPGAGTVASALGGAVRSAFDVPTTETRASFVVEIGADGHVQSVRVAGFKGGDAALWERAAQAAQAQLKGRALAMNETYAKGATVRVTVTSKLQMPDGSKSGVGRLAGAGASFDVSNIGAHAARQVSQSFSIVPH